MIQDVSAILTNLKLLSRRLALAALVWLALVAAGGMWVLDYRLDTYRAEVRQGTLLRMGSTQENMENHFRSLAALAQVLSRQPGFAELLGRGIVPDAANVGTADRDRLRQLISARPDVQAMNLRLEQIVHDFQIRQVYLQDAYGTSVADSAFHDPETSTIGANFRIRSYFTQAMESGAGFQFIMGRVSRKPGFNFTARIADGDNALGILILKTDPASMARIFADTVGRSLLVVDAQGVIVAGNRPDFLIRQVPGGPSLQGREREMEGAYLGTPKPLDWQPISLTIKGQQARGLEIAGQRHLLESNSLGQYPYAIWILSPLSGESTIQASTLLGGLVVLGAGWVALWATFRRMERKDAIELARKETLEMTRALPLTLFRYRVAPDGVGRFAYIGQGVRQLFGMDEHDLSNRGPWIWQQGGTDGRHPPTSPTEFLVEVDGRQRWISTNCAQASASDGSLVYDGYWLDVTDRRQAELRFEAAFEHASCGFFFMHREHGIQRGNPTTLALFGARSFAELQGLRPWDARLTPERQPNGEDSGEAAQRVLDHHKQSGGTQTLRFEWRHRRLDGTEFDAEIMLIWLGHEDQDQYFVILNDVTARKNTEDALKAANDAAQAATRAKSAFLANMSHEIRTPMNAIIGMTRLALEDGSLDKLRGYVGKAHQAANNLLAIINDVLDMSKIEAGHLDLEHIEFSLQDLLAQVTDVLALPADQKGLELLYMAPPEMPARLVGDPTRLRQILMNLGSNAIKFTDKGSVTIGMEIQRQTDSEIVLHGWVRDTGIGMNKEAQQRLFQPFSQGDASTTRRYGGTGLGLTISRQLAERMQGHMWLESEPDRGSTFHFAVHLGVARDASLLAPTNEAWRGKRLLLVDDNPDARLVLGRMASGLGLQVDTVDSGEAALQMLATAHTAYDWILLDWRMPEMDGITCARHIRTLVQTRFPAASPCILLVTAFNREEALKEARDALLADVLTKPVTPSTLFDSLVRTRAAQGAISMAPGAHNTQGDTGLGPMATSPGSLRPQDRPGTQQPLAGTRILLVEDQPMNQELACELLQRGGATVVTAEDGKQALETLGQARQPFDCVLMDCQMPRMDGYTATRLIRADARWRQLPIIAMTASALSSDRDQALSAGMNDHVPKPLDVQQMYVVVERWIRAARQNKARDLVEATSEWHDTGR